MNGKQLTLKMVWHRYKDIEFCIFAFLSAPYESCEPTKAMLGQPGARTRSKSPSARLTLESAIHL
jgi:hypothetical protein